MIKNFVEVLKSLAYQSIWDSHPVFPAWRCSPRSFSKFPSILIFYKAWKFVFWLSYFPFGLCSAFSKIFLTVFPDNLPLFFGKRPNNPQLMVEKTKTKKTPKLLKPVCLPTLGICGLVLFSFKLCLVSRPQSLQL